MRTIWSGGDEVAGADADGFDGGVGGGEKVGFAKAGVELGDAGEGLGETTFAGGDVLGAIAGVREFGGGEGLLVTLVGGLDVFGAGAGLEDGEALAGGLG